MRDCLLRTGYLHAGYAHALAEFGTPLYLSTAQGWLLQRPIPATQDWDVAGCYPFFACHDWQQLHHDIAALPPELVSLTLVTDPLGQFAEADLRTAFPDLLRPYKEHFVVDLQQFSRATLNAHHRRNVRQALSQVAVEVCHDVLGLEEWVTLYDHLVQRHHITGIAAFSRASFAAQWQVPGLTVLRATQQGETVGMTLWYRDEDRVYYHLAAYSPRGYECKASYALFHAAIEHFAQAGLRWMALGAGAGVQNDGADGLTRFKRGWATETRPVYLCGRILNQAAYHTLTTTGAAEPGFFPAYRHPLIARSHAA